MEPEAANFLVWTRRDPTGHLEWQDLGRQKKRNPFTPPLIRSSIDINGVPWFPFFFSPSILHSLSTDLIYLVAGGFHPGSPTPPFSATAITLT